MIRPQADSSTNVNNVKAASKGKPFGMISKEGFLADDNQRLAEWLEAQC